VQNLSLGMNFWRAPRSHPSRLALWACGSALALIAAVCHAQGGGNVNEVHQGYHPEKDTNVVVANQGPDIRRRLTMHAIHAQNQLFAAANVERKRQMSTDSERLLQLAAELNAELAKLGDLDLPLTVKADAIEKLARAVKDKMKLTMAPP